MADANHVTANWPISVALGGVRVQAPSGAEEQAREIIATYASGEFQRELEHEVGDVTERCPACGSDHISKRVSLQEKLFAVGVFLLSAVSFPTRTRRAQCSACRHAWFDGG